MKATELRIGNWVIDNGLPHLYYRVLILEYDTEYNYSGIPLTPEILEKAGSKKETVSGGSEWEEYDSFHGRITLVRNGETFHQWNECDDGFYSYKSSLPINSVH